MRDGYQFGPVVVGVIGVVGAVALVLLANAEGDSGGDRVRFDRVVGDV